MKDEGSNRKVLCPGICKGMRTGQGGYKKKCRGAKTLWVSVAFAGCQDPRVIGNPAPQV